jgi:hypothetical protein
MNTLIYLVILEYRKGASRNATSARDAVSAAAIGPTDRGVPELNLPALRQPGLKTIAIDYAGNAG